MREKLNQFGKKRIVIISAIVLVVLLALIFILVYRRGIRATTMRLLRYEGTVTMEENGTSKSVKENLRLRSGNALDTAVSSLVSIGLDDTKIVTMDELSRSEFNQKGKYLNLNLTKGSIFFEVDKPLAENETFEIETSTMIVGIRGTSGWVSVSGENESIIITDGKVHVIGTNPVTGEVKEIDVKAGQRVTVYLYNDREVDSIMFVLEDITERDLPLFVIRMLRENPDLLDKVVRETGWDKPWILGITDANEEPEPEDEPQQNNNSNVTVNNDPPVTVADVDVAVPDEDDEPEPVNNNTGNDEDLPPVAVPTATALERQIEAALARVTSITPEGIYNLDDGTEFDPDYYGRRYPDVEGVYGADDEGLLAHYVAHGQEEGRFANQQEEDDKLLADMLAHAPAPSNNNNNVVGGYNPVTALLDTNTGYYTLNNTNFTYTNGVLSIANTSDTTVVIPSVISDGTNSTSITIADLGTTVPAGVSAVDVTDLNPSIGDMGNYYNSIPQNTGGSGAVSVNRGNVSVYDANVSNVGTTELMANVSTGTGGASSFMNAYNQIRNELNSTGSSSVYGVNYATTNGVGGGGFAIVPVANDDPTVYFGTIPFYGTRVSGSGNSYTIDSYVSTPSWNTSDDITHWIIDDTGAHS